MEGRFDYLQQSDESHPLTLKASSEGSSILPISKKENNKRKHYKMTKQFLYLVLEILEKFRAARVFKSFSERQGMYLYFK